MYAERFIRPERYIRWLLPFLCVLCFCCTRMNPEFPDISDTKGVDFVLHSSDATLQQLFDWATYAASQYVGSETDPVGPWYEAASSGRNGFCARDVSHMCIGQELNGCSKENVNMMQRFAQNMAESRDYCSYWEINKDNGPIPDDYESDQHFWYNLNVNFDLLQACYRLYQWTGNAIYLNDPALNRFYDATIKQYRDSWQLGVDQIMERPLITLSSRRGIPSYDKEVDSLRVSADLIAVIYKALQSYGNMALLKGDAVAANDYWDQADAYADLFHSQWWHNSTQCCYAYKKGNELVEGGDNLYPLWFGLVDTHPKRVNNLLTHMQRGTPDKEEKSHYPMLFYRYGMNEEAYRCMKELFMDGSRDYPEISSTMIEALVCGLAGVDANVTTNRIATLPRFTEETKWVAIENIPVFSGRISVFHQSERKSQFLNKSNDEVIWRAMFPGEVTRINGSKALPTTDVLGNTYSYLDITCPPGKVMTAMAK